MDVMFPVLLLYFPGVWQRVVIVKKQVLRLKLQIAILFWEAIYLNAK